jgi:anti-sigma B factor antagonist
MKWIGGAFHFRWLPSDRAGSHRRERNPFPPLFGTPSTAEKDFTPYDAATARARLSDTMHQRSGKALVDCHTLTFFLWFCYNVGELGEIPRGNVLVNEKELKVSYEIRRVDLQSVLIVHLRGSVDAYTFNLFEEKMTTLLTQGAHHLLLDFQGLDYINSTGLGFLLGLSRQMDAQNGKLVIANMPDKIHHIFDLLGMSDLMGTFAEEQQAMAALGADERDGDANGNHGLGASDLENGGTLTP